MQTETPYPLSGQAASVFGPNFTALRFSNNERTVHVRATGINPTSGFKVFFYVGPELIFPPRLHFANLAPDGIVLEVLTPYDVSFAFNLPPEGVVLGGTPSLRDTLTIYTAKGPVTVKIQDEAPARTRVALKDFAALIEDDFTGRRKFIAKGVVVAPTTGWTVELLEMHPQGINPAVKLLRLEVTPPSGPAGQKVTDYPVQYTEIPPHAAYALAHIDYPPGSFTLKVQTILAEAARSFGAQAEQQPQSPTH